MVKYWPANQVNNADRIVLAESGGNAWAIDYDRDGTVDRGLFQVNSIHASLVHGDLQSLFNPDVNVQTAAKVWAKSGWCAWTTAKKIGLCE